jgi:hypothetical protein
MTSYWGRLQNKPESVLNTYEGASVEEGMQLLKSALALARAALVLTGCISHRETVYPDVDRVKVSFENDAAARLFYETLTTAPNLKDSRSSETSVCLPIIFEHRTKVVSGNNVAFNNAVMRCDTNKDGVVTEAEARIFAENKDKI